MLLTSFGVNSNVYFLVVSAFFFLLVCRCEDANMANETVFFYVLLTSFGVIILIFCVTDNVNTLTWLILTVSLISLRITVNAVTGFLLFLLFSLT